MWFAALIPVLSQIFGENGPIGQYLKSKAQRVQAKADLDTQIQRDKLALASTLAQAAVDSERNKLSTTGQGFKFVTFCMLSLPIVLTCFFPEYGKRIFENLAFVPVAWFQMWATVIGVIWGLPIAANAMTTILASVQQLWESRNAGKIAKIVAMGEANGLNIDQAKKQIFDIMRKTTGSLTQHQVDAANPVVDKAFDLAKQALDSHNGSTTINTGGV